MQPPAGTTLLCNGCDYDNAIANACERDCSRDSAGLRCVLTVMWVCIGYCVTAVQELQLMGSGQHQCAEQSEVNATLLAAGQSVQSRLVQSVRLVQIVAYSTCACQCYTCTLTV